jgi:hypothetical protein
VSRDSVTSIWTWWWPPVGRPLGVRMNSPVRAATVLLAKRSHAPGLRFRLPGVTEFDLLAPPMVRETSQPRVEQLRVLNEEVYEAAPDAPSRYSATASAAQGGPSGRPRRHLEVEVLLHVAPNPELTARGPRRLGVAAPACWGPRTERR